MVKEKGSLTKRTLIVGVIVYPVVPALFFIGLGSKAFLVLVSVLVFAASFLAINELVDGHSLPCSVRYALYRLLARLDSIYRWLVHFFRRLKI